MIGGLQLYLNKDLIQCRHIDLEKKKLIDSTCEEFVEFFSEVEIGKEFLKKELFENLKKVYEEYSEMQLVKFTRLLREAAKIKGVKITERKSGIERDIRLGSSHPNPLPKGEGKFEKVDEVDATFFDS